ncbi:diacylglycerol/lipid kinase family protein [Mucilaginibacter segetis]|uniref:Diacylglycerol kinase family lipid kinase n=1 Tax=Mucilaginibacter segetis TaxID=2793071 RepID=A0A934PUM3_9SPHI|nr:diacylglycerol kinase family protein [Mucilaginibacter segetis]MBK0379847.1 diacylglycerol kinase family lipid kinase [Mucilaginibacter segetis]
MKRKALFIINPVSGGKKKDEVPELIQKYVDPSAFETDVEFTSGVLHARSLAKAAADEYDIIVAVGGDGTINEIASAIAGTDTVLGIIPYGSGNGLSRFLNIPMNVEGAFKTFNAGRTITIDAAKMNDQWFFNMAGMGFDAHISHVFAQGSKTRGFYNYLKSSIQEIASYKAQTYQLLIDGKPYEREAFMLSFANSSQYGNNAHISPEASVQDGLLDVCIIKPFPLYRFPEMGLRMITKTANKTSYVEIIQGKHIEVSRKADGAIHLDGEPQVAGTNLKIDIVPATLKVIVGVSYKNK